MCKHLNVTARDCMYVCRVIESICIKIVTIAKHSHGSMDSIDSGLDIGLISLF